MSFPVSLQTISIGETQFELFVPDEAAVKLAYMQGEISFPYWSKIWPSALALSRFIIQHPQYVQNKKLAELGAGLGLPSLVAALYAREVLCTDHEAAAVAIAQQSATHNQLTNFKTAVVDWQLQGDIEADVLLLSDVNYEPANFKYLLELVSSSLQKGITIIISTPQRLMAKDFINPLLQNCIQQEEMRIEQQGEAMITVLVLAAKEPR